MDEGDPFGSPRLLKISRTKSGFRAAAQMRCPQNAKPCQKQDSGRRKRDFRRQLHDLDMVAAMLGGQLADGAAGLHFDPRVR